MYTATICVDMKDNIVVGPTDTRDAAAKLAAETIASIASANTVLASQPQRGSLPTVVIGVRIEPALGA